MIWFLTALAICLYLLSAMFAAGVANAVAKGDEEHTKVGAWFFILWFSWGSVLLLVIATKAVGVS